jgi:hypothetical protein
MLATAPRKCHRLTLIFGEPFSFQSGRRARPLNGKVLVRLHENTFDLMFVLLRCAGI